MFNGIHEANVAVTFPSYCNCSTPLPPGWGSGLVVAWMQLSTACGRCPCGWSRRAPLAEVVLKDRWPPASSGAGPAPPPSHLRAPDQAAVVGVRDAADTLLTAPGSLGVLDWAVDRVLALGHRHMPAVGWSSSVLTIRSVLTGSPPTTRRSPATFCQPLWRGRRSAW